MLKNKIFFILFCSLFFSCSFSDEELKKGWWKYGGGQYIGDIVICNESTFSNDTIYQNKKAIGVIVDREESIFGITSRKIFIKPLIKSVDIYEENFKFIKMNAPNSKENYVNPYPKGLGVYHQK